MLIMIRQQRIHLLKVRMHRLTEGTEAADHADGSTTDGQSTDGGDTAEEQEAGATADTGTAADASTDTQDDGTEN